MTKHNNSALFTLYLPYLPIIENTVPAVAAADPELTTALAALRFACKLSTDISCKINQNIDTTSSTRSSVGSGSGVDDSLAILAAPAGATCYSVIVAFAGFSRIFPHEREECAEAIAEKFESLRLFSHRWGIAGMLFLLFPLSSHPPRPIFYAPLKTGDSPLSPLFSNPSSLAPNPSP